MKEEALQFPIELFPKAFQEISRDCETSGGFPVSFTASSMLLAVATAIGNSRSLSCPIGIASTCSLFMALLGGPGAVKTPSMAFAMQPLRERDDETLADYALRLKEYRASLRAGEPLDKPTPRQLITDDITVRPNNNPLRIEYSGGTKKYADWMRILKSQRLINLASFSVPSQF